MGDATVVVVLVFGGLLLRRLKQKGVTLVKEGLTLGLFWGVIQLGMYVLWDAIVTAVSGNSGCFVHLR